MYLIFILKNRFLNLMQTNRFLIRRILIYSNHWRMFSSKSIAYYKYTVPTDHLDACLSMRGRHMEKSPNGRGGAKKLAPPNYPSL